MPNAPVYVYWDACVFISYLKSEEHRQPVLDAIVDQIRKGNGQKIVTSTFSLVEVAFVNVRDVGGQMAPLPEEKLDAFWADDSLLDLIDFSPEVARLARSLLRQGQTRGLRRLKPADAVHLASAQWMGVEEFCTYNTKDFKPFEVLVDFKIIEPYAKSMQLALLGTQQV